MINRAELPKPPEHVPKNKWDDWFSYWDKIYLGRQDDRMTEEHNLQAEAEYIARAGDV